MKLQRMKKFAGATGLQASRDEISTPQSSTQPQPSPLLPQQTASKKVSFAEHLEVLSITLSSDAPNTTKSQPKPSNVPLKSAMKKRKLAVEDKPGASSDESAAQPCTKKRKVSFAEDTEQLGPSPDPMMKYLPLSEKTTIRLFADIDEACLEELYCSW